jgi:lipocalin
VCLAVWTDLAARPAMRDAKDIARERVRRRRKDKSVRRDDEARSQGRRQRKSAIEGKLYLTNEGSNRRMKTSNIK